jgi:hypothetical protein
MQLGDLITELVKIDLEDPEAHTMDVYIEYDTVETEKFWILVGDHKVGP